MPKRTISLVLGSGGAKGYSHIGAIKAIEEANYKIKSIAGTSIGALVGGIYAAGKIDELYEWLQSLNRWNRIFEVVDLKHLFNKGGFISGQYIVDEFVKFLGADLMLSDLKMPFSCVAVDVNTGQEIVFTNHRRISEGESANKRIVYIKNVRLVDAIRASISMPGIFIPHEVKGRHCIDGCSSNGLPLNHLYRAPGSRVVAINIDTFGDISMFDVQHDLKIPSFKIIAKKLLHLMQKRRVNEVFMNSYYIGLKQNKMMMLEYEKPDIYVNVDLKGHTTFSFTKATEIYHLGYTQMKEKVKEMTHEDNLAVWQKGLLAEKGVSLKEIMKQCNCDKRTADQDLLIIKSLIATTGARIESEGIMTKRYRLSQEVNVLALYAQSKVAVPYRDLMNLLTRSRGLLSTGFFTEISSVYDEIMSTTNTDDKPIEFESNINESVAMPYFTEIFKALRKEALLVTRHHSTNPNKSEDVILHPEYLKEYNSEWYVFGNISEETEGKPVCGRIPLSMIDNITSPATPVAFIPTGKTSADYFSMLSEVIGVEVDPNCKREVIQLRVSTRMFHRIHNNPIHSSQKDAPSLDVPGYKGLTIEVRRNKELMRTLLNMGSDVEVVSPKHIRNSVKKELAKNMKLYQEA